MIVQFRENGNQDLKVQITLWGQAYEFHFLPLPLGSYQLRHHMIVTYGKQKYSFVPHSRAILHFCAFGLLSFLLSPPFCLLLEILIQTPLSIVSFCVRYVFNFQLTNREELWKSCTNIVQYFVLIHIAFLRRFWLLFAFWLSIPGMGSFIYNILFTLLSFHRSFAVTP